MSFKEFGEFGKEYEGYDKHLLDAMEAEMCPQVPQPNYEQDGQTVLLQETVLQENIPTVITLRRRVNQVFKTPNKIFFNYFPEN